MKSKKHLWVLLAILSLVLVAAGNFQTDIPPYEGWVNDFLGVFTPDQKFQLTQMIEAFENETGVEIVVVTINYCDPDPSEFRVEMFNEWGVGKKEKDNGLLIIMCYFDNDPARRTLAQETGYGLEGVLPDLLTRHAAEKYYVPHAREENYAEGLIALTQAYIDHLSGEEEIQVPQEPAPSGRDRILPLWCWVVIVIVVVVLIILMLANSDGSSWSGGSSGGSSSGGIDFGSSGGDGGFGGLGGGSSGGGGSNTGW